MEARFGSSCVWCLSVLVNLGELLLRLSWRLSAPHLLLLMYFISFGGFTGFAVMLDEGFFISQVEFWLVGLALF